MSEKLTGFPLDNTMLHGVHTRGMFHLTTIVDDLEAVSDFFARVFGVKSWQMGFFAKRYARFSMVGDVIFDHMSPDHAYGSPFRTFRLLAGQHFIFPCFYVKDSQDLVYKLRSKGHRITGILGDPVMGRPEEDEIGSAITLTHPWDTGAEFELFEFASDELAYRVNADPRLGPGWEIPEPPADSVGVIQASHHTIVLDDEALAVEFFVDVLGGTIFRTGMNDDLGARSTFIALGDDFPCTVELAVPVSDGPAREDQQRNGNIYHSVTFQVVDLDTAEQHLKKCGVGLETRTERLLVTDPATSHGLRFGFTADLTPGDPRGA